MLKKCLIILLCLLQIITLSGCWNYTEIDQQAIVAGLAIDKGENGKKYHVTAEILDPGKGGKEGDIETSLIEADGDTMFEALRKMVSFSAIKPYFGHYKVLIISKDIAKEGIKEILDLAFRDHEVRMTINVVVSKAETAREIFMQETTLYTIISYKINDMLDSNVNGLIKSNKSEIYYLVNELGTEGISPILPVVDVVDIGNKKTTFKYSGIGVFDDDRLIGFLNEDEAKIYLFISNSIKNTVLSLKVDEEENDYTAVEIFKNKTKVTPEYKNNKLQFNIETKAVFTKGQLSDKNDNKNKTLTKIFESYLKETISSLIKKVQTEYKVDIFGFGSILSIKDNKVWKEYRHNWNDTFKDVKVTVKCEGILRGSGYTKEAINVK